MFVALSEETPDFDSVYGGIVERILPHDLSQMRFAKRDSYELACNWKVYVDNFLEGYHLPYVHPRFIQGARLSCLRYRSISLVLLAAFALA